MRRSTRLGLVLTLAIVGCSPATPAGKPVPAGPSHGGELTPIPDGLGYVEVVIGAPARPAKGKPAPAAISVYFLKDDATAPIDPPPGDALLTLALPGGDKSLPLKVPAKPEPGLLVTEPGDYGQQQGLSGELAATVSGKAVKIPILIR